MNNNYRALTRTYRPQTFDDIVSQEHVSNTLKNAIKNGRLSHAYMFCGPRGVGKTTMARVLAREVNEVDTQVDGEALSRTLNIVEMDAASNRKIEDVRSLKEVIRVPPQNGRYKIFIIDEVHMLTKEAFNALLKTLEEPPPHAIFIFATTEPHKVLPTILSRVQRFDFKRISVAEIVKRLRSIAENESISIDDESLHVIAKKADGALRDALGLMDQAIAFCGSNIEYKELLRALNIVDKEHLFEFMEKVKERNAHAGLTLIRDLLQAGTDIQEFLVSLTEHIRNLYIANHSDRMHLIEATEDTRQQFIRQAKGFTEEDLIRMLHMVSEAQVRMKDTQQPKVQFEILMLKMVHMSRVRELNALLEDLDELKKNSGNGGSLETGHVKEDPDQANLASPAEKASGEDVSADESGNAKKQERKTTTADTDPNGTDHGNSVQNSNGSDINAEEKDAGITSGVPSAEASASSLPDSGDSLPESDEKELNQTGTEDDELFGKPSLGYHQSWPDEQTGGNASGREEDEQEVLTADNVKVNSVEDILAGWEDFLETVEKASEKTLYMQVQRLRVDSLEGRELVVKTDNEFARNIVDENRTRLSRMLKKEFGVAFGIRCLVERENRKESRSLNPYEEFLELQRKDPHIRTLVELFGAELEY